MNLPLGASGSSTIKTKDLAWAGTSAINKGGLISAPSQVYLLGICSLPLKAGEVRVIFFIYLNFTLIFNSSACSGRDEGLLFSKIKIPSFVSCGAAKLKEALKGTKTAVIQSLWASA